MWLWDRPVTVALGDGRPEMRREKTRSGIKGHTFPGEPVRRVISDLASGCSGSSTRMAWRSIDKGDWSDLREHGKIGLGQTRP